MKATVDFFAGYMSEFIQNNRFKNIVLKRFGTTTVDGIEVFEEKFQIYPGTDSEEVQEVLGVLGLKSQVNDQKWEGVQSAWLYFNPNKNNSDFYEQKATEDYVQNKLNNLFALGTSYNLKLNVVVKDQSFKELTRLEQIKYIEDNFRTLYSDTYGSSDGTEESISGLAKYVIYDEGEHFSTSLDKPSLESYVYEKKDAHVVVNGSQEVKRKFLGYSVSYIYTVTRDTFIQQDSKIVKAIVDINQTAEQKRALEALENTRNNNGDVVTDRIPITNTLFYKDYLRLSITNPQLYTPKEFTNYTLKHIDTGYEKKKSKWYNKIIAIVIFAIAVWLAIPSGGTSLTLSQVSFAFAMVTVNLTVASLLLNKSGYADIANSLGAFVKMSSFISTITGIGSMVASIARQGLITYASTSITGFSIFSMQSLKYLSMAADFFYKNRLARIQTSNNQLQEKADEQERELMEMYDQETNLSAEYIKYEHDLLNADNIEFEVDYKYEGTKLNIQRRSFY